MKKAILFLCLTFIALAENCTFGQLTAYPWTMNVKVIDEDGNPVVGADAAVSYNLLSPSGQSGKGISWDEITGLTDDNGMFSASHTDASWTLGVAINKNGYYVTHLGHQLDGKADSPSRNSALTLLLKRIGKPIPMYAKSITYIKFPILNKPVGYDLTVGDWVAPYGKGANADFLFTQTHTDEKSGYILTVNFSNSGDGIQVTSTNRNLGVSGLLSPHQAPIDGYQPEYDQTQIPNPSQIYLFRVRTVLDANGNVKSALYGKIYGDFMQFKYYLNPTPNDRNIEFDPKNNLLGGLESYEQVDAP